MNLFKTVISITLIFPLFAYADNMVNDKLDMGIKQATKSVLNTYYNATEFDKDNVCYHAKYDSNSGLQNYCLKTREKVRIIDGKPTLYLLIHGKVLEDTARATNGLGGLFVLKKLDKSHWYVSHKTPYIEVGQGGYSPLEKLKLTQIGQDNYGWTGEITHSGSGQYVKYWTMYAPIDSLENDIKEVAQHNTLYEYNSSGSQGTVNINDNQKQNWYPITVTTQGCDFDIDIPQCTEPEISYMNYSKTQKEYIELIGD